MDPQLYDTPIHSLLEALPLCQNLVLNSIDLKTLKLTRTQLFVLFSLMDNDYLSMSQIAQYLASSKEQATRSVAPLADEGYVERFKDPHNRKHVLIRLTPKGKSFIQKEAYNLHQSLHKRFLMLSAEDRASLCQSTDITITILKKLVQLNSD